MLENKGQKQRNKMQISFQKAQILILFEQHTRANKIQIERETSYDCLYKERQKSLAKCKAREKQCVANCTVSSVFVIVMVAFTRAVFTVYWIAFGPTRQLFRIELLFTHENGDFGAISVTERSCAAPILSLFSF